MFIRLLDGHPQMHVKPVVKSLVWPARDIDYIQEVIQSFDLTHLTPTGFVKKASVSQQATVPIYFDFEWYMEIINRGLESVRTGSKSSGYDRQIYNLVCTAHFNAWRNYQNLYGPKKWMVWHYGLSPLVEQSYADLFELFGRVYPDGKMIFMTRPPLEWVNSIMRLDGDTQYKGNFDFALSHYKATYRDVVTISQRASKGLMLLDFSSLVEAPEAAMRTVCDRLAIDWTDGLLTTTSNNIELTPNASTAIESTSSVTRQVLEREIDFQVPDDTKALFAECEELYRELSERAVNKGGGA